MFPGDGTSRGATWAGLQLGEQQAGRDATQAELLGETWGLMLDLQQALIGVLSLQGLELQKAFTGVLSLQGWPLELELWKL